MKIIILALLLILPMSGMSAPHLFLHFDINKTLIASDRAKHRSVEDVLKDVLAEKHLEGETAIYEATLAILRRSESPVFPSFYRLLEALNQRGISYTLYLRSFGVEVLEVSQEINRVLPGTFSLSGEMHQGILSLENGTAVEGPLSIYTELKRLGNVAVHDDWNDWASHGKSGLHGKPFYIDRDDGDTLSIFFDDNICEEDGFENIISPIDVKTGQPISIEVLIRSGQAVPVDTLEAILDIDYFLKLVEEAMQKDINIHLHILS